MTKVSGLRLSKKVFVGKAKPKSLRRLPPLFCYDKHIFGFKTPLRQRVYYNPTHFLTIEYFEERANPFVPLRKRNGEKMDVRVGEINCSIEHIGEKMVATIDWARLQKKFHGTGLFNLALKETIRVLRKNKVNSVKAHVFNGSRAYDALGFAKGEKQGQGVWRRKKLD
jgi:hypothetical protein